LKPAWTNSSHDSISKTTRSRCTEGLAKVVECLLCKCEALCSNPSLTKKKKVELINTNDNKFTKYFDLVAIFNIIVKLFSINSSIPLFFPK
jgi:hypothetical protein